MRKYIVTRGERIRTASRRRREQEKEELRQTILKAAGALFLELGYSHFSMRRLAEEIGYSAATLYLYFRDKDDLLFTVVDEGFKRFSEQMIRVSARYEDPWERLSALSQAYVSFGLENPVAYQLMFMWRTDFLTGVRPGEEQPRVGAFGVLQDAVEYAMEAGVMEAGDAESVSDALWAMMHGIVSLAISMPMFETERIQKLTDCARSLVFRALYKD